MPKMKEIPEGEGPKSVSLKDLSDLTPGEAIYLYAQGVRTLDDGHKLLISKRGVLVGMKVDDLEIIVDEKMSEHIGQVLLQHEKTPLSISSLFDEFDEVDQRPFVPAASLRAGVDALFAKFLPA
ncbi:MAG: hypothetical protein ABIH84_03360 [bacterium]